jgi:thioredoxin reductase (NADPH)
VTPPMMANTGRTARAGCPFIVAVDGDERARGRVVETLERRYGADYRIAEFDSADAALEHLRALARAGEKVALVVADQWLPGKTGVELLREVSDAFPLAKRGLLIEWGAWGDRPTADAILGAMTLGDIDYYVPKPWRPPDEFFHRLVTEFLHEWSRTGDSTVKEVVVVGERRSVRAGELRGLLTRSGVPFTFRSSDSTEGRRVLEEAGQVGTRVPVVKLVNERVLVDPSNAELASAYGVSTSLGGAQEFDLIVVGAGPGGLAAAVYASSEGLKTLVVEAETMGGQAASSSLIRNYLGFSRGVSGAELAQRAYQQAWVFGTHFLYSRRAVSLATDGARHRLRFSDGTAAMARAVVLATGVSYRRLTIPALEEFAGTGVFYGASTSEAALVAGGEVYVVGGGNSAGQAAIHLCRFARRVTLLVRGSSLAASMSRYLCDQIAGTEKIDVRLNTEVVDAGGSGGRLERITVRDRRSGETGTVDAVALFVLIGARPHTDWLPAGVERDAWGYVTTGTDLARTDAPDGRWPLERPPRMLETSLPGVFAVGDCRHRSVKRVASAVGEGSIVVQQIHQHLAAEGGEAADSAEAATARPGGRLATARVEPAAGARG